jgi:hypothetical protein
LLFWFAIVFPWWHHNDSLEWVPALKRVSLWDVVTANPIPSVLTYRPLGTALAWLTFHATGGELWLQQLINLAFSCAAWLLAARSCTRQNAMAWVGLLCTGGYFSGYIYLFHLHGVFYGPLLLWLAWLCCRDGTAESLGWLSVLALAAALFHTYALIFACAVLVGECFEKPASRHTLARFGVVGLLLVAAWLLTPATSHAQHLTLQQVFVAYRMLEIHPAVQVMSGLLALACVSGLARTPYARAAVFSACVAAVLACLFLKLPPFLVWMSACLLARAAQRRFGQAALIAAAAVLPAATGTGSPVYAVFATLPCAVATAESLTLPVIDRMPVRVSQRLAPALLAALALIALMLRAHIPVPVVSKLAKPLLAEKEKTVQLARVFQWLDTQPQLAGNLQLCTPAETPASSAANAVDRSLRAPTYASFFRDYVRDRYADRLSQPGKSFSLCFGGQSITGARPLLEVAGRWTGSSTLYEGASKLKSASASLQAQ